MELHAGGNIRIKGMLAQPPRFYHKATDTVAIYRTAEFFLGNGKPGFYGRFFFRGAGNSNINHS